MVAGIGGDVPAHLYGRRQVEADKRVGKKEVDLVFDGCLDEIYSPLESEVLVPRHAVTVEDPGTHFMGQVLSKGQLGAVGKREAVMIVEWPPGMYPNVEVLGKKMAGQLGKSGQPGGVFAVRSDGSPRRTYPFLANPGATTPVSKSAVALVRRALEAEFLPTGTWACARTGARLSRGGASPGGGPRERFWDPAGSPRRGQGIITGLRRSPL